MSDRKPSEYLVVIAIANLIILVASVYFANYVFVYWQKIPMDYYGWDTLIKYNQKYGSIDAVQKAIKGSMFAGLAGFVVLNVVLLTALFSKPKRELHGSAKFASTGEVSKTGLTPSPKEQQKLFAKSPSNPSILVGKYKGKFLEFFGNEFTFVAAPTRSGKGVSIVIPNLLHYRDSVVVLDIKNENWALTAGFRSQYQPVYLFSPSAEDYCSHCYNPLDYIERDETKRMAGLQNLASILYPTIGVDGNTAFFNSMAQSLLIGIILYMMETPNRPCTFAEALKLLRPAMPLNEWIVETINKREKEEIVIDVETGEKAKRPLSIECVEALMTFAGNDSENTRSGISSSCISPLLIFGDPMVAAATSKSDFRLDDVRKKKMSIYVGIKPSDLERFEILLNLFFSQLISVNTAVLPEQDPTLKYQCLVLLDEFTALGRVGIIQKAVAYIAGYNMRLLLIFQSKNQVEDAYGKDGAKSIFANMACQVMYAPQEQEEAEEYSRMLGTETVKSKSISRNRGKGGGGSVSTSDQSRALMLPQELKELSQQKEIVIMRRTKPILADKIVYYEDPVFAKRMADVTKPEGLPIKPAYIPKKLDVMAMLSTMRGERPKKVESYADTQKVDISSKEANEFFDKFNKAIGFDADFFELDKSDNKQGVML